MRVSAGQCRSVQVGGQAAADAVHAGGADCMQRGEGRRRMMTAAAELGPAAAGGGAAGTGSARLAGGERPWVHAREHVHARCSMQLPPRVAWDPPAACPVTGVVVELKIVGHANVTLVSSLCMRLAISCACMSTHWCMHAIVSFVRLKTDITTEVSRRASWSLTPALSPCTGPSPVFNSGR